MYLALEKNSPYSYNILVQLIQTDEFNYFLRIINQIKDYKYRPRWYIRFYSDRYYI